jgi:two-component system sensor histidine kinase BaeS
MQRRLAIALVLTALVSILLVGFGVLAIAQLGARSRAEDEVNRGLNVLEAALDSTTRSAPQIELLLASTRSDLRLQVLEPVVVTDEGAVSAIGSRQRRRLGPPLPELPPLVLTGEEVQALDRGETVRLSVRGSVYALRTVPAGVTDGAVQIRLVMLAGQRVTAVNRQAVAWFVLSSLVVLIGALVAGLRLAQRLVRPIRDIQATTAAIAAGDLAARVGTDGDDEVAQLGHSVNRMAADLERSKALDRQFLMSVSHDLRTPLTAISGYAEALRDRAVDDPAAAGEVIGNHAARLDRLVGDLLDLAKLDANRFRLDLRPVDLSVLAGRTAAGLVPEAAQHGVTLTHWTSGDPIVIADPDRIAQAVGNMIHNAITFADREVLVEIGVEGDRATVAVRDDGPGFAQEDLPHVFDRLYTGEARPRRAENPSGLGLAIVRELAAAMEGRVGAANNPGGGACIELSLPLADRTSGPAVSPGPAPPTPPPEAADPSRPPGSPAPPPTA